nr:immunoglobulin heavy chain junction region [Macaca mulatta]
CVRDQSNYDYW